MKAVMNIMNLPVRMSKGFLSLVNQPLLLMVVILFFSRCNSTPSCEKQVSDYNSCVSNQMNKLSCDEMNKSGSILGAQIGNSCGKESFSSSFATQCKENAEKIILDVANNISSLIHSKCATFFLPKK